MNNIVSNTDSNSSKEVYNVNKNSNRNNIFNSSRISDTIIMLNLKYPQFNIGISWVIRLHCGY